MREWRFRADFSLWRSSILSRSARARPRRCQVAYRPSDRFSTAPHESRQFRHGAHPSARPAIRGGQITRIPSHLQGSVRGSQSRRQDLGDNGQVPGLEPSVRAGVNGRRSASYRWAAGEVPGWVLFQRPPVRTRRASFPATGSPVIAHAGHQVPFRRSALRIPPGSVISDHLVCFALWTAFPPSLAGRNSCDYYQTSVAIGLASLRRSHVRPCCTYRAELRWPTHLLEYPRWASLRAPEVASANE